MIYSFLSFNFLWIFRWFYLLDGRQSNWIHLQQKPRWYCYVENPMPCPLTNFGQSYVTLSLHSSTTSSRNPALGDVQRPSTCPASSSDSGAFCDRSNSQPVPGPDGESQTTALRMRAIMSTQFRKYAQANAYHWLDQWHTSTLVIAQFKFWMTRTKC